MKKYLIILLTLLISRSLLWAQVDSSPELKPFYSTYLYKKINTHWSADNYSVLAMKSFNHEFWLVQSSFGVNYKVNKIYAVSLGYGIAFYKYGNPDWWGRHYPDVTPNSANTVAFNSINFKVKRNDKIGANFKLSNKLIAQRYFPQFEKYQTRIQYNVKFSYRKNKLPAKLKPYVQGALYYYLNGVLIDYYDENFTVIETAAPNGIHRIRIKLGTSLSPLTKTNRLKFVLFFALNREFNMSLFSNDINTPRPSRSGNTIFTSYPFNNYNILGFQVNYFFK